MTQRLNGPTLNLFLALTLLKLYLWLFPVTFHLEGGTPGFAAADFFLSTPSSIRQNFKNRNGSTQHTLNFDEFQKPWYKTPMELATTDMTQFTSDPFELEILTDDEIDIVEPDDPYFQELTRITNKMAAIRTRRPPKHMAIVTALLNNTPKLDIIKDLKTSYVTIAKVSKDPEIREYVALLMRSTRLRKGPSIEARAALLWRIALDNQHVNPRVSIAAVETLNKQDGTYKDDDAGDGQTIVKIQQFVMPAHPGQQAQLAGTTLEGEFTPVTVETNT